MEGRVDVIPTAPAAVRRTCPNCGAAGEALPGYESAKLVQCESCGLVFSGDLPSEEELAGHYAGYPESGSLAELTARRYRELLEELARFRQTGRLLDVGCGDGHFLVVARELGWQVYGSEYGTGPLARCHALGLDVRPAPFEARGEEAGGFDVVTSIEVFEHVTEPLEEARRIRMLLRPGGALYVTTPNFASLTRRLVGARWRAIEYPEHLNYFTPSTLDKLLSRAGFRRASATTTGLSPSDLRDALRRAPRPSGTPQTNSQPVVTMDQALRNRMSSSSGLETAVRIVNRGLGRLGAGDTIKALYVRS